MEAKSNRNVAGEGVAVATLEPAHRVLDGLGRLAATAAIYGDAHAKVVAMAADTAGVVASLGPAGCAVEVDEMLAADEARATTPFAGRIARDLDRLGARRLEIPGDTAAPALVEFVHFLRRAASFRSARAFEAADFSALPAPLRVTPRLYRSGSGDGAESAAGAGAPGGDGSGLGDASGGDAGAAQGGTGANRPGRDAAAGDAAAGDGSAGDAARTPHSPALDRFFALQVEGGVPLDARTVRVLDQLVRLASRKADAAGEHGTDDSPQSLRDLVRAAAESLARNARNAAGGGGRPIDDILGGLRGLLSRLLPDAAATELHTTLSAAIDQHMRDAFAAEPAAQGAAKRKAAAPPDPDPPAEEVLASVREFTWDAPRFRPAEEADPVEELSILLQLHGRSADGPSPAQIEERVRSAAGRGLNDDALDVIDGWVRQACELTNATQFDELVRPVVSGLRARAPLAFATSLLGSSRDARDRIVETAWPYLAEALLAADAASDSGLRDNLADLLARVSPTRVRYEGARLAALLGPADPVKPPAALAPPRPALFPVYDVLVGMRPETGWPAAVCGAFSRSAASHPFAVALEGLRHDDPRARRLLERAFRDGAESETTRTLAAELIVLRLRNTPREARDAPEVLRAIRALGSLPCRTACEFLESVVVERRLLICRAWPEDARAAAVEARITADYRAGADPADGAWA